MLPKTVVDFDKIQTGADGVTQHSENDCEVIPPERMDDIDAGECSQKDSENEEYEEEGCKNIDGVAPISFVRGAH